MSLLNNFPHRVTHSTPTYAQSTYGGDSQTWTSASTGIEAWVQSASHNEITEYARRNQTITHTVLLLPADADDMSVGDRLTVTTGDAFLGQIFEIRSLGERTSGLNWMWTAAVELID